MGRASFPEPPTAVNRQYSVPVSELTTASDSSVTLLDEAGMGFYAVAVWLPWFPLVSLLGVAVVMGLMAMGIVGWIVPVGVYMLYVGWIVAFGISRIRRGDFD